MRAIDSWSSENFEDHVETTLIAMYESNILKTRSQAKFMCANKKELEQVRKRGPYIAGLDRIILKNDESEQDFYDVKNDGFLNNGVLALMLPEQKEYISGYLNVISFERVNHLPKHWKRKSKGPIYKQISIVYQNKGIFSRKAYYTVCDDKIYLCDVIFHKNNYYGSNYNISWHEAEKKLIKEHEFGVSMAMQYEADRRFCWSIKAEEKEAKVTIGCNKEEVKSLLYARSLPMTDTGRKRPVLHLVEAHKRRIRNGTDVNVTQFLRGTQQVEMNGTLFTVLPPKTLSPEVSQNSQRYFDQQKRIT